MMTKHCSKDCCVLKADADVSLSALELANRSCQFDEDKYCSCDEICCSTEHQAHHCDPCGCEDEQAVGNTNCNKKVVVMNKINIVGGGDKKRITPISSLPQCQSCSGSPNTGTGSSTSNCKSQCDTMEKDCEEEERDNCCQENDGDKCAASTKKQGMNENRRKPVVAAMILMVITVLLSIGETVASIYFGSNLRHHQKGIGISLLGYGSDSGVEIVSACLVFWRFHFEYRGSHHLTKATILKERIATFSISLLLTFLALSIFSASVAVLASHKPTKVALSGIIISCISIFCMVFLYLAKITVNLALQSKALASDAGCTRNCILLSAVLLIGSCIGYTRPSIHYVDAATAIVISLFILYDGLLGMKASLKKDFNGGCGCEDDIDGGFLGRQINKSPITVKILNSLS